MGSHEISVGRNHRLIGGRTLRYFFVAALIGTLATSAASGGPTAVPRHQQPVLAVSTDASDHGGVATEDSADINGDGYVDVVITRHNWRTFDTFPMLVLLNNRRAGFADGTSTIFDGAPPRLQWPRKSVIADFNNDGRPTSL